jgi:hypothetical protein
MPAQTTKPQLAEYAMYDTDPPLQSLLLNGDGSPIDLTGATVVINIGWSSGSYGYSPMERLVDGGACVVADQGSNLGWVTWNPQSEDLNRWGTFRYNYEVTNAQGKKRTVAPNGSNFMQIHTPVGGVQYASPT